MTMIKNIATFIALATAKPQPTKQVSYSHVGHEFHEDDSLWF
jgi:hypothetical protein